MHITNITEIRKKAGQILKKTINDKEPTIILQRSKPVAYIVDVDTYEHTQKRLKDLEEIINREKNKNALQKISKIRAKMKSRGRQPDSTEYVRELREEYKNE